MFLEQAVQSVFNINRHLTPLLRATDLIIADCVKVKLNKNFETLFYKKNVEILNNLWQNFYSGVI